MIRAALPTEIQLPQTDDEVHQLLKSSGFATPLGHLDQAIEAHTGGDWAACNSQLRAFLEACSTTSPAMCDRKKQLNGRALKTGAPCSQKSAF